MCLANVNGMPLLNQQFERCPASALIVLVPAPWYLYVLYCTCTLEIASHALPLAQRAKNGLSGQARMQAKIGISG